ncbi:MULTISPECIES: ABC transporter permease [Actinomycetes]|uniref:Transport permease protein n=2 Tax=Actinomycetes TaxID=1760 RepID=A0ABP6M3C0_9MICC
MSSTHPQRELQKELAAVRPHSPGPRAWWRMTVAEAKMVVRDTAGLILPLGMPVLILVMQALAFGDEALTDELSVLDVYVLPLMLLMVVASVAVVNMPSFLATYRKTHILRRLAVTPASPAMVLVAQAVVSVVQIVVGIVLAFTVASVFFDASLPTDVVVALAVMGAAIASLYAIGMLVAAVSPTPNASLALGLIAFFGLAALGGLFGGMQNLPETLQSIGVWLPFGAAVEGLQQAWLGQTVDGQIWVALALWTAVGGGAAALLFRWE